MGTKRKSQRHLCLNNLCLWRLCFPLKLLNSVDLMLPTFRQEAFYRVTCTPALRVCAAGLTLKRASEGMTILFFLNK